LYTAEHIDEGAQRDILSIKTPTLKSSDHKTCEGPITCTETTKAVKGMEPNKSPGIDRLTVNFYQHFWDILAPELTAVYNYANTNGTLSLSQRRGVITLVFKKQLKAQSKRWKVDRLFRGNWYFNMGGPYTANQRMRILSNNQLQSKAFLW